MATAPLVQYRADELARVTARQAAQATEVSTQRAASLAAQATQLDAGSALTAQSRALDAARKALAGIPTPADGDPLLIAMQKALVGVADAQAALAAAGFAVALATSELQRRAGLLAGFDAALADAKRAFEVESAAAAAREARITLLTTAPLDTLAADAATALNDHAATAQARVEGEFPSSATDAQDFVKRVRARRAIVWDSLASSATVEAAAAVAAGSSLMQAQRAFDAADAAVASSADAAPRLAADAATLARLAALPAANPPLMYPILTPAQSARLNDATQQAAREAALAKLKDVDTALSAARAAQVAYDEALHAAMQAEPDKTQAELDASTLAAELGSLNGKLTDLGNARAAMSAAEIATVQAWFACVPDALWAALDQLDGAIVRLTTLVGPPTPADLIAALAGAEATLATTIAAADLAARKSTGAAAAWQRASGALTAEQANASQRATAYAHSAALF